MSDSTPNFLEQISTRWTSISDPVQFVMRYAPAIRNYLGAILTNSHDADEVAQDFLVRAMQRGFALASPDRGRFRDYLKTAVRNTAYSFLRKNRPTVSDEVVEAATPQVEDSIDKAWLADWQQCVMNRAWRALELHQHQHDGNLFYTVLRLTVDYPDDDSKQLAARASDEAERPVSAEAFRKQLSRSRRRFAELLVDEVKQTLEAPTPERIEEEIADLGLTEYVRDILEADEER